MARLRDGHVRCRSHELDADALASLVADGLAVVDGAAPRSPDASVRRVRRTSARKLREEVVPGLGEDRLGVELHAVDRELAVAQAHHDAVLGLRGDLEAVGHESRATTSEWYRVAVSGSGEAGEHAGAAVADLGGLAVHHLLGPHDLAAVDLADALVAEAHAEHRDPRSPKSRIASFESPASSGRPGPGEIEHRVGLERPHLVEGERVVAVDHGLGAELTQVLDEVVDERVVVVDHQHPGRPLTLDGTGTVAPARPG